MKPQTKEENQVLQLKKIAGKKNSERKRLLIIIGILAAILIGMVVYASFRVGGVQNLLSGNSNPLSNVINNTGSAIVNPTTTSSPTPVPTELVIPSTEDTRGEIFLDRQQNFVTFVPFSKSNDYTIKKGTSIMFQNRTERLMALKFSDGRQVRLDINDESNSLFVYKGKFTYYDALDLTTQQIRGTITVVD